MDWDPPNSEKSDSVFVWDENSQLYFHASSGFYHDPNAGWYYSSRDGHYYKFEDGNYVLLDSTKDDAEETYPCKEAAPENTEQVYGNNNEDSPSLLDSEFEAQKQMETLSNDPDHDLVNSVSTPTIENPPPPPSEWLEDMLIDLYLSGYKTENNAADTMTMPLETDDGYAEVNGNTCEVDDNWIAESVDANGMVDKSTLDESIAYSDTYELEEGEWIPDAEDLNGIFNATTTDEGILSEEEKWRAQYGQVIESETDLVSEIPVVDMWDWEMVKGSKKDGKDMAARLVGRIVKQSAKRHPSIPSGGGKFRSAPISEVHLDLDKCTDCEILVQDMWLLYPLMTLLTQQEIGIFLNYHLRERSPVLRSLVKELPWVQVKVS
ncbi:hypothetical protein PIB30_040053 [Stylosanthes scabra]|uniref:OCRE domain-containing protein n=1 Tax=Stylosanthes scabra TaxID=79078 RepID=A0ABU6UD67_9FABA|nr:hypothetical protein [Stylosanthes scabra]